MDMKRITTIAYAGAAAGILLYSILRTQHELERRVSRLEFDARFPPPIEPKGA